MPHTDNISATRPFSEPTVAREGCGSRRCRLIPDARHELSEPGQIASGQKELVRPKGSDQAGARLSVGATNSPQTSQPRCNRFVVYATATLACVPVRPPAKPAIALQTPRNNVLCATNTASPVGTRFLAIGNGFMGNAASSKPLLP